ncbi:MAG: IMP dehydrogenase [Pirellulales bacterium]|nr:IMP dehydrogenase [Pirellulales bacterium]
MTDKKIREDYGLTFDDVLLVPRYSEVVPADCDVSTRLTNKIRLNIPMLSSPMDTVTESEMAIALAQEGGLGVIHKNMSIERQAEEVEKVKRSANGIIVNPETLPPDASVGKAREIMDQYNVSGLPITGGDGRLVGIITRRDLRFLEDWEVSISEVMTAENLVTATGTVTLEEAEKILMAKKVEKLLLVDEDLRLTGLITIKDIDMMRRFPQACKDGQGRLRVGAAVGVHDNKRVDALIQKGVDLIVVDSAHGHSSNIIETLRNIKKQWDIEVVAGNVATAEGCKDLIAAGADAVKVGIGPGSICTTRVISGVGVPQITAIRQVSEVAEKSNTPVIADGGIRYSGDLTKAIAAGADAVMIGGLFAGLQESPGDQILFQGRTFKVYRGMGSLGAMVQGSSERYRQAGSRGPDKLVPEGVEGRVPFKGQLGPFVYQLVGGLRAGMGYCGTRTIEQLRRDARFIKVTPASVRESHPHDITITQEAPNYSTEYAAGDS